MFRGHLKLVLLKALSQEASSGYALMKQLEERLGSKPSPGSIYPLLDELAKEGHITCEVQGRSKIYSITKEGRLAFSLLEKQKVGVLKKMQSNMKIWGMLSGEDVSMHHEMLGRLQKDELPFGEMSKDMLALRQLLAKVYLLEDKKKTTQVKKIIQETNKKLKTVLR